MKKTMSSNKYLVEMYFVSVSGNPLSKRFVIKSETIDKAYDTANKKISKQKNWMKTNGGVAQLLTN